MRALDPANVDQLVCIKGMVIRASSVIPDLKQAFFRCFICGHTQDVLIDRGRIEEPQACLHCNSQWSNELIHNRCLFTDKQLVRLQETPDEIPEGETPHTGWKLYTNRAH
jgi:DNA replication licensing factor MCM4